MHPVMALALGVPANQLCLRTPPDSGGSFGAKHAVFPYIVLRGMPAIWLSFAISMLSHFGVGAARSVFTGRNAFRSGLDMFVVGLGIAVIGYLVGEWISHTL